MPFRHLASRGEALPEKRSKGCVGAVLDLSDRRCADTAASCQLPTDTDLVLDAEISNMIP